MNELSRFEQKVKHIPLKNGCLADHFPHKYGCKCDDCEEIWAELLAEYQDDLMWHYLPGR